MIIECIITYLSKYIDDQVGRGGAANDINSIVKQKRCNKYNGLKVDNDKMKKKSLFSNTPYLNSRLWTFFLYTSGCKKLLKLWEFAYWWLYSVQNVDYITTIFFLVTLLIRDRGNRGNLGQLVIQGDYKTVNAIVSSYWMPSGFFRRRVLSPRRLVHTYTLAVI